jgi:hypothetical protein
VSYSKSPEQDKFIIDVVRQDVDAGLTSEKIITRAPKR